MIAATARVRRLTVATRNVRDFRELGVEFVRSVRQRMNGTGERMTEASPILSRAMRRLRTRVAP